MIPLYPGGEVSAAERAYAAAGGDLCLLMERAGRALADRARSCSPRQVTVLCGPGSNGGDGYAAALFLHREGVPVLCLSLCPPRGNAEQFARRLTEEGGSILPFDGVTAMPEDCDLLLDALFGTGLSRAPEGEFARAIELCNASGLPVLSADLPSGVSADGVCFDPHVTARETVSFVACKPGAYLSQSYPAFGRVTVESLGMDPRFLPPPALWAMEEADALSRLPRRVPQSHKGNYARVLLVVGAQGYSGAAILSARAALRSGAGLVFVGVPRCIYPIVAAGAPEAVVFPLPDRDGSLSPDALPEILSRAHGCGAVLLGCGLSRAPGTEELVRALCPRLSCPLVLDADGINAFAGHIDELQKVSAPLVLTPHAGELARLLGGAPALPEESQPETARRIAKVLGCTLVMKDHRTLTAAPDGRVYANTTGNAGMARGGSGDVLAGMLTALYAADPTPETAAAAVWFHGRAGDLAAERLGPTAMVAGDLICTLSEAFRRH